MKRFVWSIGVLAAVVVLAPVRAMTAQGVTTAAVAGVVTDSSGAPLEGARVIAVHGPSGTEYAAVTRADGRFTIPGMRVGGPYNVSVTVLGYRRQVQDQIQLTLGGTADLRFVLARASVELAPVTVTATTNHVFSAERTGAATTIASTQIAHLPTINRRVEDLLRLTPQYSPMSVGFSFAGQDNRLNNMTIDGSYFNNSFGLAGQPGDRTSVAPISLDALEQVQVNVAPYDVRQGNFVGAGINMVTKSGTNEFSGSMFYNGRSDNFVGTQAGPNTFNPGTFQYHDVGVALGGPIIRNRLFFFGSFENDGQTAPGTTFRANLTGGPVVLLGGRLLLADLHRLEVHLVAVLAEGVDGVLDAVLAVDLLPHLVEIEHRARHHVPGKHRQPDRHGQRHARPRLRPGFAEQLPEEQLQLRHRPLPGLRFPRSVDAVPRATRLQPERP